MERVATRIKWPRLMSNSTARAGFVIVVFFLCMVPAAPILTAITGNDPHSFNTDLLRPDAVPAGAFGGMSLQHPLGVEPKTGRDLLAIVTWGSHVSLFIGLASTAVSVLIGVVVGVAAGFFGGVWDRLLSRITDIVFGFPFLIFAIALAAVIPPEVNRSLVLVAVIGLFGWPSIARVVRAETLSLRTRGFVRASIAQGASGFRTITREILPNLLATILVFTTLSIPGKIGAEATLSFLGVGVDPSTPSWGRTISDAIDWVQVDPAYLLFPGLAIFLITLGFTLLGDGLRDAVAGEKA